MKSLPAEMSVVEISSAGGPEVLASGRRGVPTPGSGEVLIRVHAAGINGPDIMQRKGLYPAPAGASDLPGLEVAGEKALQLLDIVRNEAKRVRPLGFPIVNYIPKISA